VQRLDAEPDLDVVYTDEDKLDPSGQLVQPRFKPEWSPNFLMSTNYVCHLLVARTILLEKVGGLRSEYDGSQDYDLVLRLTELTSRIAHIPEPLYSWRIVAGSAAAVADAKPYALAAATRALQDALQRRQLSGTVTDGLRTGLYRIQYRVAGAPRVAIVIPTRDRLDLLKHCVQSVVSSSTYPNYELVVIDNQSREPETLEYLATLPGRVISYPHLFNYARMMNLAAREVDCDAILFLNNDTEIINDDWIEALLEHAMRPDVGAVGGRLYFADGRVQHEGILVGVQGVAINLDHRGFWGLGDTVRDCSAVTGACTMVRSDVFWEVGGNDERLRVAYNDVDLCLRIRQAGYEVVYTPYAQLFHYESATRSGYEHVEDSVWFRERWHQNERCDPYYSPNYEPDKLFRIAP
jgi:GT2 family glycosyltransferase